jgi:transcriptional regulator NrdR family protein
MKCPLCHSETLVKDSRPEPTLVKRRRACESCGHTFTTTELITSPASVHKRRERQRLWAANTRAVETDDQRKARIKRWKTRKAARIEAVETGQPVTKIYEQWGVA